MVFEQPWAQKRMLLAFEKSIFQFFANFWMTKLKPFSGKVMQSVQNYLNQNFVIRSFLENGFRASWSWIPRLCTFEKDIFEFFADFWVTKLKPFPGKVRQSVQNYLNQNLAIRSFLENSFQATWSPKRNVLSIWKGHFPVFCKFLSDEVETVFWENEAKP